MGILNVTPDSFYDGGRFVSELAILKHVEKMIADGVSFIDVGAYSSRPGAADISIAEEKERALAALKLITQKFPDVILSIDTFRSEVARAAVNEGASIINDISGGELDAEMFSTVAELKVPYVLMHMRGTPQTMTSYTEYGNLINEVIYFLQNKIAKLLEIGVVDVIVDPGFGFSKTVSQNFELLKNLKAFNILGKPILVGLSRKSMVWRTLAVSPEDALTGTTALHAAALLNNASVLRVHDVKEAAQTIKMISLLR